MTINRTNQNTGVSTDRKMVLSTLWIFAMFNYLYADVIGLIDPAELKEILTGTVGSVQITEGFLLGASILMETAIAMVLLSRILKYKANRWANIIAGVIHTAAVFSSMFVGSSPTIYYIFFGTIEIACTLFIIWYAWTWRNPES
jgi:hypothetical protein